VIFNDRGTPIENPLFRIIDTLTRQQMAVIRSMSLNQRVEYIALSAEAKTAHGLSPVLAILDEVGQVRGPQDDFIDAITTSQGPHENPLLLAISTQAANDADLFSVWIDDALASKDPKIVCHVHAAPKDAPLMDETAWRAARSSAVTTALAS